MQTVAFSVSDETIQGKFHSIEESLKQVKSVVANCKKAPMEGDKFPEVMEISLLMSNIKCIQFILYMCRIFGNSRWGS